jgi:hypothetical protein
MKETNGIRTQQGRSALRISFAASVMSCFPPGRCSRTRYGSDEEMLPLALKILPGAAVLKGLEGKTLS